MSDVKLARVGVAVLIRRGDGALLMGLRKGAHGEGTWAPPGGRLEARESVKECAARELVEETGLVVDPADVEDLGVYTLDHFEGGGSWVTLWCVVDLWGTPMVRLVEPEKCAEWRWTHALPGRAFPCFESFIRLENPWTAGGPR